MARISFSFVEPLRRFMSRDRGRDALRCEAVEQVGLPGALNSWKHLLAPLPQTISFPVMTLTSGRDHEPLILTGRGEIEMRTTDSFEYRMSGLPENQFYAFKKFVEARKDPYDTFKQFRLTGTDDRGIEWLCGWTSPGIGEWTSTAWTLIGTVRGLSTDFRRPDLGTRSGVDLVFLTPLGLPVGGTLAGVVSTGQAADGPAARFHVLKMLGTTLVFTYNPRNGLLTVSADTSDDLPHPFAENWIGEPLWIIFGQLLYPRLVARNFSDGRSQIWLRPSPGYLRNAEFASLWNADCTKRDRDEFWRLFAAILAMISRARGPEGRGFESHVVTRLYEEIALAARGSRWVWTLTLASAIEGLANILSPPKQRRDDADHEAITQLTDYLNAWDGPDNLRTRVISDVHRAGLTSAMNTLRSLRDRGILTVDQVRAWSDMRNSVMHGNLVSPWSTRDEDRRLRDLANLFHRLARQVLDREAS